MDHGKATLSVSRLHKRLIAMHGKSVMAMLLAVLCANVAANESASPFEYTKPDKSLRLVSKSNDPRTGYPVVWRGKIWLTGKLVVEYCPLNPCSKEAEEPGRVFFEPDIESEARLPAVTSSFYPRRANVISFELWPLNTLMLLLGKDRAIDVHIQKPKRQEYMVRVLLTEFTTLVDCNARHYSMSFEKIELAVPEMVALDKAKRVTCAG
jgi:hypothetical protein